MSPAPRSVFLIDLIDRTYITKPQSIETLDSGARSFLAGERSGLREERQAGGLAARARAPRPSPDGPSMSFFWLFLACLLYNEMTVISIALLESVIIPANYGSRGKGRDPRLHGWSLRSGSRLKMDFTCTPWGVRWPQGAGIRVVPQGLPIERPASRSPSRPVSRSRTEGGGTTTLCEESEDAALPHVFASLASCAFGNKGLVRTRGLAGGLLSGQLCFTD